MRKNLFALFALFLCLWTIPPTVTAQQKSYKMNGGAFYNLENLFDTIHAAGKNDYEFLPNGSYKWNTLKYTNKLTNMSQVLASLCTEVGKMKNPLGAAVIGVSEIENRTVLEDLLKQPALKDRGYEICFVEGPDRRGVDCAFFYNPALFKLEHSMLVPYIYLKEGDPCTIGFDWKDGRVEAIPELRGDTTYITRGFLVMSGQMEGEKFHFIVCHWPSRSAASPVRERAGDQVKELKEALLKQDPNSHIVIMGDFNDDPKNKSMRKNLGCKEKQEACGADDLYNPWYHFLYKVGQGTLLYQGNWNLFDQIVFTGNLLGKDRTTWKYYKSEIFMRDYLFQTEGKYKGSPKRTTAGGVWLNGYSDHLPVQTYFVKEVK